MNALVMKGDDLILCDFLKVALDAGHGGRDPGAINGQYREKDLTLKITRLISDLLVQDGMLVYMLRENDYYVSPTSKADMANKAGVDIFVSIHINGHEDPTANGIETFHFPTSPLGKKLAGFVQSKLIQNLGWANRGVKTARFTVLSETSMPAILPEIGFITNDKQCRELQKRETQIKAANAIVNGILLYSREVN